MDCVNHPGVNATAYCQSCGRGLCAACVRRGTGGQILCESCWTAWQAVRAPFVPAQPGVPNPGLATFLGFIPGVGAMYNGQFLKGFIHVIIFAVLVSMTDHFGIFGLFVAAWVFYQVFDAHQTAKARRDGLPLPDPLGLNELSNWLHAGFQTDYRRTQPPPPPPMPPAAGPAPAAGPGAAGGPAGPEPPAAGFVPPAASAYQGPHSNPYQSGYQPPPFTPPPYGTPFGGAPPVAGFTAGAPPVPPAAGFAAGAPPIPPIPPVPPVPPVYWRRREPIAAIVLIAMGLLFLMGQLSGRVLEYSWPVLLIGLGAWLIFRRMHDGNPLGAPTAPAPPAAPTPPAETQAAAQDEPPQGSQGGSL